MIDVGRRHDMIDHRQRMLMSQNKLAARFGKSQAWVSNIENGYAKPTPEEADVICELLNLPPDYFQTGDDDLREEGA